MVETLIKEAKAPVIGITEKKKAPVMDDLKRTKNAFNEAIKTLPKGRILDFINMIQSFTENSKHEPIINRPKNKKALEVLGIELYPDFSKRTEEANGLKCLEENYSPWLKKYTPSLNRDYISQAHLSKLDPQLLARIKTTTDAENLKKIIPTDPDYKQQKANAMTEEEKKAAYKNQYLATKSPEAA